MQNEQKITTNCFQNNDGNSVIHSSFNLLSTNQRSYRWCKKHNKLKLHKRSYNTSSKRNVYCFGHVNILLPIYFNSNRISFLNWKENSHRSYNNDIHIRSSCSNDYTIKRFDSIVQIKFKLWSRRIINRSADGMYICRLVVILLHCHSNSVSYNINIY